MEIFQELFLTVVLSLGLAFLIAKLVSVASAGNVEQETLLRSGKKPKEIDEFDEKVVAEERSFIGELKSTGLEIEQRVEYVEKPLIVDKIEGDLVTEGSLEIVQDGGGVLNEGSELVEVGSIEHKEEDMEEKEEEEEAEKEVKNVDLEEKSVKESCCKEEEEMKVGKSHEDCGLEENLVVEKPEKVEDHEIGQELVKEEQIVPKDEQIGVGENENNQETEIGVEKSRTDCLFSDEEDWEGIERSDIENIFGAASTFVSSGDNNELLSKLGSDVQMQLYGLHKVATEGPCYEPQPLALMVSSRAKWHAWQRLGNMSPEVAMEQYTALLSESVPGWMERNPEDKSNDSPQADISGMKDHKLSSFLHHQPVSEDERKRGDHSFGEGGNGTEPTKNL
ncbi:Acyl-CoA-binding protein [Macleaya cordata]|uniref:Acyl-CoA-binding protein n=1 Tax=Macleaya cordata TaxID=56857 RepID=A0A200R2Y2_MACCD|nr:Acyl-CoA-binding protein [Macleaya cordata]